MNGPVTVNLAGFTQQLRAAQRPPDLYLGPEGLLTGDTAAAALASGLALPFGAGGAFSLIAVTARDATGAVSNCLAAVTDFRSWLEHDCPTLVQRGLELQLHRLTRPLKPWAGLSLQCPLVMGIVNVTPDSFSDGGDHADAAAAVTHGRMLMAAGADILDIGGESTRPGATPVSPEIEIARVVPVVTALARAGAIVSIDTRHTQVMVAALDAGARIINDVSALQAEGALALAVARKAPVVLMHMPGDPQSMQSRAVYGDPALDVWNFLDSRLGAWESAGGDRQAVLVDPGIGFGKTAPQSLAILRRLGIYRALGTGVLLGVSRKRLIEHVQNASVPAKQRFPGSLALALDGIARGANIIRAHDVAETVQGLRLWQAVRQEE